MNELLQPILALGGFGYLNYIIYSRIDNPDFGSESDKKFMILLYSSMNYGIYLLFKYVLNIEIVWAVVYTILASVLLTLLFPLLSRVLLGMTNVIRKTLGLTKLENTKLKESFLEKNEQLVLFIFSVPENKLLASGHGGGNSREYEDFSLRLYNFAGNEIYCRYVNEDSLMYFLEDEKIDADIYINIDKKIKIISFPLAALEQNSAQVVEGE